MEIAQHKVTLASYPGKWLLLFFGFTACPDACPTTMISLANALNAMGDTAKNVQAIFVTIDPARDSPDVLKDYLANFDGNVVGLSGTPDQVGAAAKSFDVRFRKRMNADGSYALDHSTGIHLVSPSGRYVRIFFPDSDPEEFAKDVVRTMTEYSRTGS